MATIDDDKIVSRPTSDKIRLSSLEIDLINEKISVTVQLGSYSGLDFTVVDQRQFVFTGDDYTNLYENMNVKYAGLKIAIKSLL